MRKTLRISARSVAFTGVVAALYAVLTITLSAVGFGPIQFRIAEVLCVLPYFFPFTTWGIFVGCIIANIFSPYQLDIIIGPIASLLAAVMTMRIGMVWRARGTGDLKYKILACMPPVVVNAVFIGALIAFYIAGFSDVKVFLAAMVINGLQVGFGQLVVLYALGLPLLIYLPKAHIYEKMVSYS